MKNRTLTNIDKVFNNDDDVVITVTAELTKVVWMVPVPEQFGHGGTGAGTTAS